MISFGKELPYDVRHIAPHLLSEWEIEERVLHPLHGLRTTMRTTLVNAGLDSTTPFIHLHRLMSKWPKESCFLLRHVFVRNDVPTWRGGRRNFIPLFDKNQILKSLLSSNPLPTKLGRVCHDRSNLRTPPPSLIKEKLIQFSQEEVNLSLSIAS